MYKEGQGRLLRGGDLGSQTAWWGRISGGEKSTYEAHGVRDPET